MSRQHLKPAIVAVIAAYALGCGGARTTDETLPEIPSARAARERARRSPNDAELQRRWATLEMLARDGDIEEARAALTRAGELSPNDPAMHLLDAIRLGTHGEVTASDEQILRTIEVARASNDPLTPFVAEVAADELTIDVGDDALTAARRTRTRAVFDAPGAIGPVAVGALGDSLLADAARRGAPDEARAIAAAMGCIPRFTVAGPFGPREQLGFDHETAAAGLGPMAASYDLGPTRGVQPTRAMNADGCSLWLGGGAVQAAGTTYAEAFVDVPRSADAYLEVSTPNSVIVRIDGRTVASLDRRDALTPRTTLHAVHLDAGRHELEVKIVSRHPSPVLGVRLVGGDGRALAAESPRRVVASMPGSDDPLAIYLRARIAQLRGDVVGAREALRPLYVEDDASPIVLALVSTLRFNDPLIPRDRASDEGRAALRRLEERDEAAWLPSLDLAELAAGEGRMDEAIDRLRAAESRFPEVVGISLALVGMLEEKGYSAEAERRLRALATRRPNDCSVIGAQRDLADSMGRIVAAREFAEALVRCDARSGARLDRLMAARDWSAAETELARLESLDLDGDVSNFWPARLRLARAKHDAAAENEILERIATRWPRADGPVIASVDARVAAGDLDGAVALLDQAVDREPTAFAPMRVLRSGLARAHTMDPYRLDGVQAIADYRASGATYDAPSVYVLDYAAVRLFPDGSYLYLVHQVVQVNSEEALDEVGEFHPPDGELLRVRTIKRDGRILEPDAIAGLESLALPRLEVGDFVEYEFVLYEGPSEALEGGVLSHRFFFQSFDGPLHRTEYLVVAPEGLDLHFDRRGPLPDPAVETRDGLRLVRFRMDEQAKPEREPFSVNAREFMPSVSWGLRARWDALRDMLADQVVDTMPRDPELARLANRVVREAHARTDREKAIALFHFVTDEVENDGSGLFDSAPGMLYDRNGNRDRVFQYLLRMVGIRADLVLVRSTEADQTVSDLPEDDTYDGYALRVMLGGEPVFVTASQRGVPFGWLPSTWVGQPGLVVAEGGESLRLPAASPVPDERRVDIEASLDDEGVATMTVTETLSGASAASWRNDLEQVPAAELEMRFESGYVAPRFPGGRLLGLDVANLDDPERPLVLRYRVEASIAFAEGTNAVLSLPMPFEIGGSLASTAERRTTAQVPAVKTSYAMRLHLPRSFRPGTMPAAADLAGPNGSRFRANARAEGNDIVVTRELSLVRSRVSPAEYATLAEFARTCDREEARPIRLLSN